MLIKKTQILLFCTCSFVVVSVAAMEKDGAKDERVGAFQSPTTAGIGEASLQEVKDPRAQYLEGVEIVNSITSLEPKLQIPRLQEAVVLFMASAGAGCQEAKEDLPLVYLRIGRALVKSAFDLPSVQMVKVLKIGIDYLTLIANLNPQGKRDLHTAQYNLALVLRNCASEVKSDSIKLLRESVQSLMRSAEGGHQQAIDRLLIWQQNLAYLLEKSAEGLSPDEQKAILKEAVDWLTRCANADPAYKKYLYVVQKNLAAALIKLSDQFASDKKNSSLREAMHPLREAVRLLAISAIGGVQRDKDYFNHARLKLARRLFERSKECDIAPSIQVLGEAKELIMVSIADGSRDYDKELLSNIQADLTLKLSQLEDASKVLD